MASKDLRAVVQAELSLVRKAEPNDVPVELIRRQGTAAAAFALACQSSGLEDKEVYGALGLDAGYFSRIKAGTATLQAEKLAVFCEVVGNMIYPEWTAYQLGCTLVQIKSEAERRAEAEKRRADELQVKVNVLMEAMRGRMAA